MFCIGFVLPDPEEIGPDAYESGRAVRLLVSSSTRCIHEARIGGGTDPTCRNGVEGVHGAGVQEFSPALRILGASWI